MKSPFLLIASLIVMAVGSDAQVNHRYPRIGIHQWSGSPDEWYAQFDLVSTASIDVEWAKRIKKLNPDVFILPTSDWNNGTYINPFPDEWYLRRANGSKIEYGGPGTFYANLADNCPPSSLYNGKRVCDHLPEMLVQRIDLSIFDGIATDGLYYQDRELWNYHQLGNEFDWDTDLDRNGVNDFKEHGEEWVVNHWNQGVDILFTRLRQLMPQEKLLLINSGSWHYHHHNETNGNFLEHANGGTSWEWFTKIYSQFMQSLRKPNIIFLDYDGESKDDFRDMRFQLTTTLYGNAYFSYSDPGSHEHYYNKFYDEYLVDLGFPLGPMQQIGSTGFWVRFFDNGAAIVNISSMPQTITDAEMQSVPGYAGPYYRFQGGQDPTHNNGKIFDTVPIWGGRDNLGTIGDGYLLLNSPKTIIYSIIIDNVDMGTSPGTKQPEFIGSWTQYPDPIRNNPYYTMRVADWFGMFAYAYTAAGNGSSRAIYRPTIGYPGYYEVYEWHGWHEETVNDEATNVPMTIYYQNGKATKRVNQTKNHGRWNSLGKYYFHTGTAGYVEITNQADGVVIADAIKFEFRGTNPNADLTPPDPPQGVKITTPGK